MTQSVSNVLVLLFWFDFNVVLVTFWVEMFGDWSVESLLLPLLDVLEVVFFMEGSVGDESVLIGENDLLVVNIASFKSQIFKFCLYWTIFVKVSINSSNTVLVWSVKIADGLPDFFLDFQIVFKVIDDFVVLSDLGFIVVLVEFRVNIFGRVGILMWKVGIFFIIDFCVCL